MQGGPIPGLLGPASLAADAWQDDNALSNTSLAAAFGLVAHKNASTNSTGGYQFSDLDKVRPTLHVSDIQLAHFSQSVAHQ